MKKIAGHFVIDKKSMSLLVQSYKEWVYLFKKVIYQANAIINLRVKRKDVKGGVGL